MKRLPFSFLSLKVEMQKIAGHFMRLLFPAVEVEVKVER